MSKTTLLFWLRRTESSYTDSNRNRSESFGKQYSPISFGSDCCFRFLAFSLAFISDNFANSSVNETIINHSINSTSANHHGSTALSPSQQGIALSRDSTAFLHRHQLFHEI